MQRTIEEALKAELVRQRPSARAPAGRPPRPHIPGPRGRGAPSLHAPRAVGSPSTPAAPISTQRGSTRPRPAALSRASRRTHCRNSATFAGPPRRRGLISSAASSCAQIRHPSRPVEPLEIDADLDIACERDDREVVRVGDGDPQREPDAHERPAARVVPSSSSSERCRAHQRGVGPCHARRP